MKQSVYDFFHSDKVRLFFFSGFAFLLPFFQQASTWWILIWAFYSLVFFDKEVIRINKKLLVLVGLFIVYALSLCYTENGEYPFLERKALLVVMPLLFTLNGRVLPGRHIPILHAFILGCLFSLICSEATAIYHNHHYGWMGKNFFVEKKFAVFHQTVYYALYLLMGLLALIHFSFKNRRLSIASGAFLVIGLFQISNRASLLVFVLLIALHIFSYTRNNYRIVFSLSVATILFLGMLVAVPRWQKTFGEITQKELSDTSTSKKSISKISFRLASWDASTDLIPSHFWLGVGVGDLQHELNAIYKKKGYTTSYEHKFNPHNTYFSMLLETGIAGLILLFMVLFFLYKEIRSQPQWRYFYISFILLLAINFIFESMLSRYSGLSFITFFYCLLVNMREGVALSDLRAKN